MILPSFILPSRANQTWYESGIDSLDNCLDKQKFKTYPHKIDYQYNSRGYRDREWPEDLKNAVWCFGDSFTVGLGCPIEHTWPHLLEQKLQTRCINVSMDGASNHWIARKVQEVIDTINPKTIVIQWSYLHRIESTDQSQTDEARRIHSDLLSTNQVQVQDFLDMVAEFDHGNITHSIIPYSGFNNRSSINLLWNKLRGASWPTAVPASKLDFENLPDFVLTELKNLDAYDEVASYIEYQTNTKFIQLVDKLFVVEQLDWARDGHHYDIQTAISVVDDIINSIEQ